MGFWDDYKDEGGGLYVTAEEKASLIDNEVAFQIVGVREDDDNQYQGRAAPRYLAQIVLPNPLTGEDEERLLGFARGTVQSRDRLFAALIDYIGSDDAEDVFVTLEKVGQAVLVRKAE